MHTVNISYFSRFTTAETFTHLALVETHHRGLENAGEVAAVMDGADWLQQLTDYHCPKAVRILDFAHAAQHLADVAQALWGQDSQSSQSSADILAWTQHWKESLHGDGLAGCGIRRKRLEGGAAPGRVCPEGMPRWSGRPP